MAQDLVDDLQGTGGLLAGGGRARLCPLAGGDGTGAAVAAGDAAAARGVVPGCIREFIEANRLYAPEARPPGGRL